MSTIWSTLFLTEISCTAGVISIIDHKARVRYDQSSLVVHTWNRFIFSLLPQLYTIHIPDKIAWSEKSILILKKCCIFQNCRQVCASDNLC